MKKLFYLLPVAGMLLASCSSEEPTANRGEIVNAQVTNYLTVNIVPTYDGATRAGDPYNDLGDANGLYHDGTPEEQKVNSIRFFFFDDNGDPSPVAVMSNDGGTTTTNVSYIDWTHHDNDLGGPIEEETVEATLTATLGLVIPDGGEEPKKMIAVINPSEDVAGLTSASTAGPTISEVQTATKNFQEGLTNSNFVMSNSVYATNTIGTGTLVNYTSLTPEGDAPSYFQSSIEAAQDNPVVVYVERVVARIDLSIGLKNGKQVGDDVLYPVMKKVTGGDDIQVSVDVDGTSTPVYVKFLGWNVTSTPDCSYLVKSINPAWTTLSLFNDVKPLWNSADYHRSFWAMNPLLQQSNYQYGNFNQPGEGENVEGNYQPAQALKIPASGTFTTAYMQENASPYNAGGQAAAPTNPTQVIIAAQLVDGNGNSISLAEWGYKKYTQDDLLKYLVTNIISKGNYYKKGADGVYTSLQPGDLKFITASEKYKTEGLPEGVHRYYSYIVVNSTDNWYQWTGTGDAPNADGQITADAADMTPVTAQQIDNYIDTNVGYTMMWNTGYTYYYFDIRHLGQVGSVAYNGVVRNHLYEANVNSLYGFGTPVCNPNEIIIPEEPKYEEVLLAAEIRILQWRVVRADYDLDWR